MINAGRFPAVADVELFANFTDMTSNLFDHIRFGVDSGKLPYTKKINFQAPKNRLSRTMICSPFILTMDYPRAWNSRISLGR